MNQWTNIDFALLATDYVTNLIDHNDGGSFDLLDTAYDVSWDIVGADDTEADEVAEKVFNALRDEMIKRGIDHRQWCAGDGTFAPLAR
jgi:hypothetical protein